MAGTWRDGRAWRDSSVAAVGGISMHATASVRRVHASLDGVAHARVRCRCYGTLHGIGALMTQTAINASGDTRLRIPQLGMGGGGGRG